ncbi:MAG: hypothetical protein FD138_3958 [Planctomycetota bacterium]|nr:MAG: hypothetical protein FD138_3958 [Planctomycetota bacterium]
MKATQHTNRISTPVSKLHWVIVSPRRGGATYADDFNGTSPENGGSEELREHHKPDDGKADADIRAGRVKTFQDADSLIASLKNPW